MKELSRDDNSPTTSVLYLAATLGADAEQAVFDLCGRIVRLQAGGISLSRHL